MANTTTEFDAFKQCIKVQANLDLEAWDVMLFQPLKDLTAWWSAQSDLTKGWTGFLSGIAGAAFTRWIARIAGIASTEIAGLFAEALVTVAAGLALGTFLDVAGRCIAQQVNP
jgi:hypothetical protein